MTISLNKINNFPSYIAFFFIASYANKNGISTRNLSPDIDSETDIKQKCSKTLNLILKKNLNEVDVVSPTETNNFPCPLNVSLSYSTRTTFNRYSRDTNIASYLQYVISYNLWFDVRLNMSDDMHINASNKNVLRLLYSVIYGRDPVSLVRFGDDGTMYPNYQNPDYGRVDTYISYVKALSLSNLHIKASTSSEALKEINDFHDDFTKATKALDIINRDYCTMLRTDQEAYSVVPYTKYKPIIKTFSETALLGNCLFSASSIYYSFKSVSKSIRVARYVVDVDAIYDEQNITMLKNAIKLIIDGSANSIEEVPVHSLRDDRNNFGNSNNVLFTLLSQYVNRGYLNNDIITTVILKSSRFNTIAFTLSTSSNFADIFPQAYISNALTFKDSVFTSSENFSSAMSLLKNRQQRAFALEQ